MISPTERLLNKFPDATKTSNGWQARCPAHEDTNPSLSIAESENGGVLLNCHAGCTTQAVCSALHLKLGDLMPPTEKSQQGQQHHAKLSPITTYTYRDENGGVLLQSVRYEPKTFKQRKPDGKGGWLYCVTGVRVVPYCLPELLAETAKPVYVVEGEKDVQSLAAIDLLATCNVGGAGKWKPEHAEFLRGRCVIVLPDNDEPGRKHGEEVARSLQGIAASVRVFELPDLSPKGDVSDWLAAGGTRKKLEQLAEAAPQWTPSVEEQPSTPDHFMPFPVESLPETLSTFVVACAKSIGCDASFIAIHALAALAAAIGDSRCLQLKRGWKVPAIIWALVVGDSGSQKSPGFKAAVKPVRDRQTEEFKKFKNEQKFYELEKLRYEKDLGNWKKNTKTSDSSPPEKPDEPIAVRCTVLDITVEALAPILLNNPRGLLLARDELSGWLGSFDRYTGGKGGGDSAHWLSMHNGETLTVDRKTGDPKTIFVPKANVSICGGIQPGTLHRALGNEHRESGMAARFLLACPPRKKKNWTESDIDPAIEKKYADLWNKLFLLKPHFISTGDDDSGERIPEIISLTPEAKTAWVAFYNDHAHEQVDLTGELSAAWSKLEEYAARLSLVIHCVRWASDDATLVSPEKLDLQSMLAGIRLVKWFKNETRRIYLQLGETEELRDDRRLVEWINCHDGTTTIRDVQRGCRWLSEPGVAEQAIEKLVKDGHGSWQPSLHDSHGGRPKKLFSLHRVDTTPENTAGKEVKSTVDTVDDPETQIVGDWLVL